MNGILRCSRYAFGPNRLHYCGPDANREIAAYMEHDASDPGLQSLLVAFRTMYPYLRLIAQANGIRDPFDDRVVEAYWIGNGLLEAVGKRPFHRHLAEGLDMKRKMDGRSFDLVAEKLGLGAMPHHSFHVLDIWKRTGRLDIAHTLESMQACRISWGTVTAVDGPSITVESEPLAYEGGKLLLGPPAKRTVRRTLQSLSDIDLVKPGDVITMHWDVPCEVVTKAQARALRAYTLRHIALANLTI